MYVCKWKSCDFKTFVDAVYRRTITNLLAVLIIFPPRPGQKEKSISFLMKWFQVWKDTYFRGKILSEKKSKAILTDD